MRSSDIGRINSIQSLGTLDGPGVRFVVFTQGCNLRCGCCHNPDTWVAHGGREESATELAKKAERYREYFGKNGGVTLSGGEPLLQPSFAEAFFSECRVRGINTCLDTSGSLLSEKIVELLQVTDRVLLDIKYHTDELYRKHVGCSIEAPLAFLRVLDEMKIPTVLRQVIIPGLNDNPESMDFLNGLKSAHKCIDGIELLPFKKICQVKYDKLNLSFPFADIPTPTPADVERLEGLLK